MVILSSAIFLGDQDNVEISFLRCILIGSEKWICKKFTDLSSQKIPFSLAEESKNGKNYNFHGRRHERPLAIFAQPRKVGQMSDILATFQISFQFLLNSIP